MKLDLDRQPLGRSQWEVAATVPFEAHTAGPQAASVSGQLAIDNLESRLVVTGTLAAVSEAICDRCLEPFALDYVVPVEWLVIRDAATADETDSWIIHQKTGEVDFAEPLREAVVIALPQKHLCAEDCRGLCPHCGTNLNRDACQCQSEATDPRWNGLPSD
jgi:uncharacterized protein